MKSDLMPTIQVDPSILNNIVEVKETVATGISFNKRKSFRAIDLWNIQRNAKSASAMFRRF